MENGEEIKNKQTKNLPIGKGKGMGEASLLLAPPPLLEEGLRLGSVWKQR